MGSSETTTATITHPATAAPAEPAFGRTAFELTLLGAIWGGSFLFMRVAASEFGPIPLVEARLALGALILLPFLWQARAHFTPGLWLRIAGIAAVNSVIPFALFAWGAERAPAGHWRDQQCHDGDVHGTGGVPVLRRADRHAALVRTRRRLRWRRHSRQRQDRWRERVAGGAGRHGCRAAAMASASTSCAVISPACPRRRWRRRTC